MNGNAIGVGYQLEHSGLSGAAGSLFPTELFPTYNSLFLLLRVKLMINLNTSIVNN